MSRPAAIEADSETLRRALAELDRAVQRIARRFHEFAHAFAQKCLPRLEEANRHRSPREIYASRRSKVGQLSRAAYKRSLPAGAFAGIYERTNTWRM